MLEIASQIVLCLLLAALIGFIIGYLLGKSTCPDDSCGSTHGAAHDEHATSATKEQSIAQTTENKKDEPLLLSAPRGGQKDNLTRIKGVGVKIEESLNKIGIYHFDQIAKWNKENIVWADNNLGFPGRAKREQWVEQAKALAAGEETEFSKRVDAGDVSSSKQS
jgi:NADH-quinone oxidoreductase subunit E